MTRRAVGAQPLFLPVNCDLIRLGAKRALVDTGCGQTMGPDLGRMPSNLRALGIAPETIDYVPAE